MPLKGAQEGLVLTITSQDYIVHWLGFVPKDSGTQLVNNTTTGILPYQEGDSICDLEASTKVINYSDSVETDADSGTIHAQEVFMVDHHWSPQKHPMSGHRMNLSPTYLPLSRGTRVRPRIKSKPEKEKTS